MATDPVPSYKPGITPGRPVSVEIQNTLAANNWINA
jgi:hypothetical protein